MELMLMTYGEVGSGLDVFSLAKRSVVLLRVTRVIFLFSAALEEHIEKEPYSSRKHPAIGQETTDSWDTGYSA